MAAEAWLARHVDGTATAHCRLGVGAPPKGAGCPARADRAAPDVGKLGGVPRRHADPSVVRAHVPNIWCPEAGRNTKL